MSHFQEEAEAFTGAVEDIKTRVAGLDFDSRRDVLVSLGELLCDAVNEEIEITDASPNYPFDQGDPV